MIDHTILKPEASVADVDKIIDEARAHGFASVCVQPAFVKHVHAALAGTKVKTCSVVGFPHGANKPILKAIEATAAVKDGADEIDMVIHLPLLIGQDFAAAKAEVAEVVRGARAVRSDVVVKVIVESAALAAATVDFDSMIRRTCKAVREGGADFIKTSTGFHPAGGASEQAVTLMRKYAEGLQVKASGGIRDLAAAKIMLAAGADRLGLSASVAIVLSL